MRHVLVVFKHFVVVLFLPLFVRLLDLRLYFYQGLREHFSKVCLQFVNLFFKFEDLPIFVLRNRFGVRLDRFFLLSQSSDLLVVVVNASVQMRLLVY